MKRTPTLIVVAIIVVGSFVYLAFIRNSTLMSPQTASDFSDASSKLSPEAYRVMYEKDTEAPFTSPLYTEGRKGTYVTADTGLPVYRSEDKYDSGTGWPSFVKPIDNSIELREDNTLFTKRVEVVSKDTGAHLGHVFDDGPADRGGKRYCMNGVALRFVPDDAQ